MIVIVGKTCEDEKLLNIALFGNEILHEKVYGLNMYSSEFYENLKKSQFTPSQKVFKIVWPVLYFLMLLSFIMVIFSPASLNKIWALFLFVVQLILNFNWSFIFFAQRKMKKAFYVCFSLLFIVVLMTIAFWEQSKMAGILQIPYCIWLILATYLNLFIVENNIN